MTFQFLCPQGHLLQGEEAHMGMQCQCPQCGTAFIIPTVDAEHAPGGAHGGSQDTGLADLDATSELADLDALAVDNASPLEQGVAALDAGEAGPSDIGDVVETETLLHIPCPNGHELETPLDMIGERVLCPHCNVEFRLRREKSIEYLREQEILDRRRAQFWFKLSIVAASFVVVILLGMIAMIALSE